MGTGLGTAGTGSLCTRLGTVGTGGGEPRLSRNLRLGALDLTGAVRGGGVALDLREGGCAAGTGPPRVSLEFGGGARVGQRLSRKRIARGGPSPVQSELKALPKRAPALVGQRPPPPAGATGGPRRVRWRRRNKSPTARLECWYRGLVRARQYRRLVQSRSHREAVRAPPPGSRSLAPRGALPARVVGSQSSRSRMAWGGRFQPARQRSVADVERRGPQTRSPHSGVRIAGPAATERGRRRRRRGRRRRGRRRVVQVESI